MLETQAELLQIADRLERLAARGGEPAIQRSLDALKQAATAVGRAWSGSWLGYHASVYYANLNPPPAGAQFSPEWGLIDAWPIEATSGDWRQFDAEDVKRAIYIRAGNPDLESARDLAKEMAKAFEAEKTEVLSILTAELGGKPDSFLEGIKRDVEKLGLLSAADIVRQLQPSGRLMSRDSLALTQGFRPPPHISVLSEVLSPQHTIGVVVKLSGLARKAGSHISRKRRNNRQVETIGTNVFIGHGRSALWKDLKDFIQDRLGLPWDEFNRVPVAGVTNIARLSEMLDAAGIAFLVMTGEDEQADGKLRARMNVVHEAGLFQGRLGFTKAIVLLEDECEEFSNIQGLGQIRFPKGNIKAAFEDIRQVLEREGLLGSE